MTSTAKIDQAKSDLREVYLFVYDQFATDPSEVADQFDGINLRYARELLGVLCNAEDLVAMGEGENGDVWQVTHNHDEENREAAVARIEAWLNENVKDAMYKPVAKGTGSTARVSADKSPHDCYCGCSAQVPSKSFYRPGHDARHAGVVGRKIAERYAEPGFDRRDLLAALPSDRLKAKAENIAEKAIAKAEAKHAKANGQVDTEPTERHQPEVEEGTVKVGKNEFVAQRFVETGEVTYFKGDKTLQASKSAAKTFQVG